MTTKNQKIRAFYVVIQRAKPNVIKVRHFIHSRKSGGFWASVRDFSQAERQSNEAIGHSNAVSIVIGNNPKIIKDWEKLIFIDERNISYRLKEKPDEFNYSKGDIKMTAYAFKDDEDYSLEADEYD